MSVNYNLSELFVLYLDAGDDTEGYPRRTLALGHGPTGSIVAVADVYQGDTKGACSALAEQFRVEGATRGQLAEALLCRMTRRIRIAPSYRTHLLRNEARDRVDARIHGKPTLTC